MTVQQVSDFLKLQARGAHALASLASLPLRWSETLHGNTKYD